MALSRLRAQPSARYCHGACSFGANLLVWGGDGGPNNSPVPLSVVERFNITYAAWQEPRHLQGLSSHDFLDSMAVASDGERTYFFGGWSGSGGSQVRSNALYVLDLSSLRCREIVATNTEESPSPRSNSGMVFHRRQLIVYGGGTGGGISDELFVFDLDSSES